jgi:hypothetical protein
LFLIVKIKIFLDLGVGGDWTKHHGNLLRSLIASLPPSTRDAVGGRGLVFDAGVAAFIDVSHSYRGLSR